MAAEQAIVPAKKVARTLGSTEGEHDHVVSRSLTVVATIDPVRITIRDLLSRMHSSKLGITKGAKPMPTSMVVSKNGRVEYDVERGSE